MFQATVSWKKAGDMNKAKALFSDMKRIKECVEMIQNGMSIFMDDLPAASPELPPGASYPGKQGAVYGQKTDSLDFSMQLRSSYQKTKGVKMR